MPNVDLAIERAARRYGIDPVIFARQINQESGKQTGKTSSAGARDIAQFTPPSAEAYGVTLGDGRIADDLDGAARYMRDNLKATGGSYEKALSIYNSGKADGYLHIPETRKYVKSILGGTSPTAGKTSARRPRAASSPLSAPDVATVAPEIAQILAQQGAPAPAAPQSQGVPLPAHAARAVLPEGYATPTSQAGAQSATRPDLGKLAQQVVATVDTSVPPAAETQGTTTTPATAPPAARGKITLLPGANKPGTNLTPGLEHLLSELGDVTVGTGTNHSTLTVNGKVSDHVSGNAADIPAKGETLTRDAARALAKLAGGKTVQWQRNDGKTISVKVTPENVMTLAAAGGLFNVPYGERRRIQVIANTHIGGDHTNHLHVGVSGLR